MRYLRQVSRRASIVFLIRLFLLIITSVCPARAQEGDVRGVHDPCLIKAGGAYYLFFTGRGIPMRRSSDLYHWERAGRVFDENPDWFASEVPGSDWIWAPDVSYFNGRFHLYYSVSTFGSNHSRIGLATNTVLDPDHPDYSWVDQGPVLGSRRSDDFNAIDPNVIFDAQEKPWLAFGSYWSGIKLLPLDNKTGLPVLSAQRTSLAARPGNHAIEAPFLIRREGFFYLFVSFDACCKGVDSTYKIAVGRSPDLAGPYLDRQGKPLLEGGGTILLESDGDMRGPGHCAILQDGGRDWLVHHFYDAKSRGVQMLQIRPISWDQDGFPQAGAPIVGPATAALPARGSF